ncbi:MAG: hypothetical protein JSU81_04625 [Candidatus Coatesbacteria bacterium]|nr:MAG: hypothetical protein JSU81_04625 [Candidatus Coatesbacteria bacterium]
MRSRQSIPIFLTAAAFLGVATAASASAPIPLAVHPRLAVVHYDAVRLDSYYNYLAAVPVYLFHYENVCYFSPLVCDADLEAADYFHGDLASYFGRVGPLQELAAVGDVPADVIEALRGTYGLPPNRVVRYAATNPPALAAELAADWEYARAAVVAPYTENPNRDDYESAANGAALASALNVPLLYSRKSNVPRETLETLERLGVRELYMVEFGDFFGKAVDNELLGRGYSYAQDFITRRQFVEYMRAWAGHSALMTFREERQSMAAAAAAARYGGFCLRLDDGIGDAVEEAAAALEAVPMSGEKVAVGSWAPPPAYEAGEEQIAEEFAAWLAAVGAEDPTALEWVTYFGPKAGLNGLFVNFERAITGDPREPTGLGSLPGRLPGEVAENVVSVQRGCLYPAIVFGNPRPRRAILAFNSFVCHYAEQGYTFYENGGQGRCVNEIFGVPEFNEIGVAERFWEGGYETGFDAGAYAGTYRGSKYHPINPANHPLEGFAHYLNAGAGFYYYSGHGLGDRLYAMSEDRGCNETVPWGEEHWPAPEGKITEKPGTYLLTSWDRDLLNIHGAFVGLDACLCGGGAWPESVHRHGGTGLLGAYTTVSWEGSGWFWCLVAEAITAGRPAAEAVAGALARTGHIYPGRRYGNDDTLTYYWAGDPFVRLYQPSWEPAPLAALYVDYGGHRPGAFIGVDLAYFRAERLAAGARLSWAVRGGAYAGFNLYRDADVAGGDGVGSARTKLNRSLIFGGSPFSYADAKVGDGAACYWLEAVEPSGRTALYGPARLAPAALPATFALGQNYPNPASAATTIPYAVPAGAAGPLTLALYDLAGRRVASFGLGEARPGRHEYGWDGRDAAGNRLPPGLYLYALRHDGAEVGRRRMLLSD